MVKYNHHPSYRGLGMSAQKKRLFDIFNSESRFYQTSIMTSLVGFVDPIKKIQFQLSKINLSKYILFLTIDKNPILFSIRIDKKFPFYSHSSVHTSSCVYINNRFIFHYMLMIN
jgi:hypothetical protein